MPNRRFNDYLKAWLVGWMLTYNLQFGWFGIRNMPNRRFNNFMKAGLAGWML